MQINQLQVNSKKFSGLLWDSNPMGSALGPQCSNNSLWRPIQLGTGQFNCWNNEDEVSWNTNSNEDMIVAVARVIAVSGLINNYSSRPHGLSLNSYWLRAHKGEKNNFGNKIRVVGQKYRNTTTLASKTRVSRHCFGFQSRRFSSWL